MSEKTSGYGAAASDWFALSGWHKLMHDLLPVVMNPAAVIDPRSKIRDKGKVPSRYNLDNRVVGFPEWTTYNANEHDIKRWSERSDYGICLQTRQVRALDIDVPDLDLANEIRAFITEKVGRELPVRVRNNSSKFLMAFRIDGEMPKRIIKVRDRVVDEQGKTVEPAWLIEFLGNGQQFIAAGTHSSGARIEWEGGLPDKFPILEEGEFDKLWKALEKQFACEPSAMAGVRKRDETFEAADDTANYIDKQGLLLGLGSEGQLFLECPWKEQHSMDSGVSECAYFPKGTRGYKQGHFKCMHASHAHKTDVDFEEAIGMRDTMFKPLPVIVDKKSGAVSKPLPSFYRDKNGEIEANLHNLSIALQCTEMIGGRLRYDSFRDDDTFEPEGQPWRPLTDGDSVKLRMHLEKYHHFKPISKEMMRDVLTAHGEDHCFDSAIEWADSLEPWDGVERISGFMHDYFRTEDTPYARAVGRYLWTAMAGRTLMPGVKADMAVILQGSQGMIKSTAISALVPWEELFAEISFDESENDIVRLMRGKLVAELGELRGIHNRELEAIKSFIVRRKDEFIPKFKERAKTIYRRTIFIGTTNHQQFLVDDTGNRRFLPIIVLGAIDIKGINRDRNQLWAEAFATFKKEGIAWKEAEELAKLEHAKFMVQDTWEEDIERWLSEPDVIDGTKPGDREFLVLSDVLANALGLASKAVNPSVEKRAVKALRKLGYELKWKRINGKNARVYARDNGEDLC